MSDYHEHVVVDRAAAPQPGETCRLCKRRVSYPKKTDSPKSAVRSFRIPEDDETFNEDLQLAASIVGITSEHKYPVYTFYRFLVDQVILDEHRWQQAFARRHEEEGPHSPTYRDTHEEGA